MSGGGLNRRGAAGQQYAIIVGLIGVVGLFAISSVGGGVKALFTNTSNLMTTVTNTGDVPAGPAAPSSLFPFTSHNFTACGKTGHTGPALGDCQTEYAGTSWISNGAYFSMPTTGFQRWTVPQAGVYRILAKGAAGGTAPLAAGHGASARGDFNLTQGQVLTIVIGQRGSDHANNGGGGGGSFVWSGTRNGVMQPLLAAGGGGGGGNGSSAGAPGVTGTSASGQGSCSTTGGSDGNGGGGTNYSGEPAAGAGWFTNGIDGRAVSSTFVGGLGNGGAGGFGGGGNGTSSDNGGGGGGGYSGGGSGCDGGSGFGGGGGASFNAGAEPHNLSNNNSGHGVVLITKQP